MRSNERQINTTREREAGDKVEVMEEKQTGRRALDMGEVQKP